jgi:hypothetical protein
MKQYHTIPIISFFLGLFASNWAFNHINAWLGVLLYIAVFGFTIDYIINKLKKLK